MATVTLSALDQAEVARLLRQRVPMPEVARRMADRGVHPTATKAAVRALEAEWRRAGAADFATMRGREVMQLDDRENELHLKQQELERRMAAIAPTITITRADIVALTGTPDAMAAQILERVGGAYEVGAKAFCGLVKAWNDLEGTRLAYMERRARMCGLDSATLVMNVAIEDEARRLGIAPSELQQRVERIMASLEEPAAPN